VREDALPTRSLPGLVTGLALLLALTGCYRFESLRTASVCTAEAARDAATVDAERATERPDFGATCGSSRRYVNRVYRDTYESIRGGGPSAASATAVARPERTPEDETQPASDEDEPEANAEEEPEPSEEDPN
jgi:hypothetical protein